MRRFAWTIIAVLAACGATASTFTRGGPSLKTGPNPSSIAAADFNDDGMLDLAVAAIGRLREPHEERPAHDEINLFYARGPLQYSSIAPVRAGFAPYALRVANIDARRAPDLLAVSFMATRGRDLMLFRNLGDELFEPHEFTVPDERLTYTKMPDLDGRPVFPKPGLTSLAVADFDRDGYRDIIATGWSSDVLVYWRGQADGYFGEPVFMDAPGGPRDIVLTDMNGNGRLDLAVTLYNEGAIGLWEQVAPGQFEPRTRIPAWGKMPHRIHAADMNGNGRMDLVVSHCHTEDAVAILYNTGPFRYEVAQALVLGEDFRRLEHEIRDIVVEDFTGNGQPDIAAACFASRSVYLFVNEGAEDGAHHTHFRRERYGFDGGRPRALCAGDFNGNGSLDLAVALWESDQVLFLLGR
jgi:hypothetical protein